MCLVSPETTNDEECFLPSKDKVARFRCQLRDFFVFIQMCFAGVMESFDVNGVKNEFLFEKNGTRSTCCSFVHFKMLS